MHPTPRRGSRHSRPVVVVLGLDQEQARDESARWRARGAVVVQAHDPGGCLRVASSVCPDVIVLDHRVPERLLRLLRAHPVSASADIQWMPAANARVESRAA
jgi:hypothetical protein